MPASALVLWCSTSSFFEDKTFSLERFFNGLSALSVHSAFYLVDVPFSMSRLVYFLHCKPMWKFAHSLDMNNAVIIKKRGWWWQTTKKGRETWLLSKIIFFSWDISSIITAMKLKLQHCYRSLQRMLLSFSQRSITLHFLHYKICLKSYQILKLPMTAINV